MTNASQPQTIFTVTIDAQDIEVRYRPYYIDGLDPYAIFEFTSPHQPRRRIPVSATGYRSFFAPMDEIEAAPSVEKCACMVALVLAREFGPYAEDVGQLALLSSEPRPCRTRPTATRSSTATA
ncbi:MAG: hypothetical protein ACLQOO_04835 [Terriglobia bacterium]